MAKAVIEMDEKQLETVVRALEIYTRISISQMRMIEEMVARGEVTLGYDRKNLDVEQEMTMRDNIKENLDNISKQLGWTANSSAGISNAPEGGRRAY